MKDVKEIDRAMMARCIDLSKASGKQGDSIHRMMFGREQDSDCLNE